MPFVAIVWKNVLEETYDPIIFMQNGVWLTGHTTHENNEIFVKENNK